MDNALSKTLNFIVDNKRRCDMSNGGLIMVMVNCTLALSRPPGAFGDCTCAVKITIKSDVGISLDRITSADIPPPSELIPK